MAENENGSAGAQTTPMLSVLAQYIKDFSFENPNAPASLRPRESSPEINININVTANAITQADYEVVIVLEAAARDPKSSDGKGVVFNAELTYAGIFRIQGLPQENLGGIIMVECPRLLFPFAREIVSSAVRNGGFPPLMIDPVDFAALYRQKLTQAAAETKS